MFKYKYIYIYYTVKYLSCTRKHFAENLQRLTSLNAFLHVKNIINLYSIQFKNNVNVEIFVEIKELKRR